MVIWPHINWATLVSPIIILRNHVRPSPCTDPVLAGEHPKTIEHTLGQLGVYLKSSSYSMDTKPLLKEACSQVGVGGHFEPRFVLSYNTIHCQSPTNPRRQDLAKSEL